MLVVIAYTFEHVVQVTSFPKSRQAKYIFVLYCYGIALICLVLLLYLYCACTYRNVVFGDAVDSDPPLIRIQEFGLCPSIIVSTKEDTIVSPHN